MLNINRILVVLDKGSNELHALKKGIWLARSVNAELTLLTNTFDSFSAENTSLDADTRDQLRYGLVGQAEQWLKSFVLDVEDIKVNIDVRWQKHLYEAVLDRKSTRLNSSHVRISYAVFCLKKKKKKKTSIKL